MKKIQNFLSGFMYLSLKIMLLIIAISTFRYLRSYGDFNSVESLSIVIVFIFISLWFYYLLKKDSKYIMLFIIAIGIILRVVWNLKVNTLPYSDFRVMYEAGQQVLEGNFYIFHGTYYFARFPHLTVLVLYFAFIQSIFNNSLMVIKIINIILGLVSVLFIYLIIKKLFNPKSKALTGAFLASIYPPFIIYSSVILGENIAITFFLMSIYLFLTFVKEKRTILILILSGLLLSIGNLFRMVGAVLLIAYILYIVIYEEINFRNKLVHGVFLILVFYIPLIIVSSGLKSLGVTEFNLWKGNESKWTSILKGTNIESEGKWSEEDSLIVEEYNYDFKIVEEASKDIVHERLTTTPPIELIKFYIDKFAKQWRSGDFGGIYWAAEARAEMGEDVSFAYNIDLYSNLLHIILMILIIIGLFNKSTKSNRELNLLFIILGGFIIQCLLTESQERYSYIASWLFIILPFSIDVSSIKKFIFNIRNLLLMALQ